MPPDQEPQTQSEEQPQPEQMSSAEVQEQIQKSMESEPALAHTDVNVTTDDSSVVLTGSVGTEEQHNLVLRIAQSYAGTRQIVDKIEVRERT